MNRNQPRPEKMTKKNETELPKQRARVTKSDGAEIKEVLSPKPRREPFFKKPFVNRCCWISPNESFGQLTGPSSSCQLQQEIEIEDAVTDFNTIGEMQSDLRKEYCNKEIGSQCPHSSSSYPKVSSSWRHVDDTAEIERLLMLSRDEGTLTHYHSLPKNFHICEVPRVKVIAAKFAKYKKCNIEVRKVEEKVVCVEYDVLEGRTPAKPVQIMRAFFSVKPMHGENKENVTDLPASIKTKFNISLSDLQKLNKNEVEIVDEKIIENRPYLEDLRKILRRRQISAKNPKRSLDLRTLYEIAKRELLEFETNLDTNILSAEELLEIQNLILINCKSSAHGISRRTVGTLRCSDTSNICADAISRSLVAELLRVESVKQ